MELSSFQRSIVATGLKIYFPLFKPGATAKMVGNPFIKIQPANDAAAPHSHIDNVLLSFTYQPRKLIVKWSLENTVW